MRLQLEQARHIEAERLAISVQHSGKNPLTFVRDGHLTIRPVGGKYILLYRSCSGIYDHVLTNAHALV